MALELGQVISTDNKVVKINPPISTGVKAYMSNSSIAGATSLTILDNTGFTQNDYIILGEPGFEGTEIVKVNAAVSAGTALTITAAVFAHGYDTPVYLIRYNQIQLYGSTSSSDTNPTTVGSAVNIDVQNTSTIIVPGTEYAYYYAKYYNSTSTTYSSLSSSALAGGLPATARASIRKDFRSLFNEPPSDLVSDDQLNTGINAWQRELWKRRRYWSFLRVNSKTLKTVQDQQNYILPTDIADANTGQAIVSVKIKDQPPLTYTDQDVFLSLTFNNIGGLVTSAVSGQSQITIDDTADWPATGSFHVAGTTYTYTANNETTGVLTGVSPVLTSSYAANTEAWNNYASDLPFQYTVDSESISLFPIPDSSSATSTIFLTYWKSFTALSNDSDSTVFPHINNCYLYLHWIVSLHKKKDQKEQETRYRKWEEDTFALMLDDPDFKDTFFQPANLYRNYY